MSNYEPFLSPAGRSIEDIEIIKNSDTINWAYTIRLGAAGYLHINAKDLDDLFHVLAKRLYDDNTMTTETAQRVAYMCNIVAQDPREALEAAMMEAGEDF